MPTLDLFLYQFNTKSNEDNVLFMNKITNFTTLFDGVGSVNNV